MAVCWEMKMAVAGAIAWRTSPKDRCFRMYFIQCQWRVTLAHSRVPLCRPIHSCDLLSGTAGFWPPQHWPPGKGKPNRCPTPMLPEELIWVIHDRMNHCQQPWKPSVEIIVSDQFSLSLPTFINHYQHISPILTIIWLVLSMFLKFQTYLGMSTW